MTGVGLGRPTESGNRRRCRFDGEKLDRRAGEPEADLVAATHSGRSLDRHVVEECFVVPAQVDEDESRGRRLDPGVNPGDRREGDGIDGDLAVRVPSQVEPFSGRFERLRLDRG
jgi:hypothetical protein